MPPNTSVKPVEWEKTPPTIEATQIMPKISST